jgi:hypothetical protein
LIEAIRIGCSDILDGCGEFNGGGFNSILDHLVGGMRFLRVIGRVFCANIGSAGFFYQGDIRDPWRDSRQLGLFSLGRN